MKNILIIAGEVSGDSHAAALISEFKKIESNYLFWGIGGDELKSQGMTLFYHLQDMAFLGITEVIKHLPFILRVQKDILTEAKKKKPVCAVLIDYPGFNLKIAKNLKKLNIPVVYYISPQLWAWGRWRLKKIRKYVRKMLVLFPFEKDFYEQHGIDVDFVGHPLVDKFRDIIPPFFKPFDENNVILGLLPGSRKQEVSSLLSNMVATADLLYKENKIKQAEIVKVDHLPDVLYQNEISGKDKFIKIVREPLQQCLPRFDLVLIASGTATLETGYFSVPMVIVYKVQALTYWLGRLLIRVKNIGLVNIVAEKEVAPELIQHNFTPKKASGLLNNYLTKQGNLDSRNLLLPIREMLGKPDVSERVAKHLLDFIHSIGNR